MLSFKIDSITLDMDPEPDPNWAKILDPDLNSMYSNWIHNTVLQDASSAWSIFC